MIRRTFGDTSGAYRILNVPRQTTVADEKRAVREGSSRRGGLGRLLTSRATETEKGVTVPGGSGDRFGDRRQTSVALGRSR